MIRLLVMMLGAMLSVGPAGALATEPAASAPLAQVQDHLRAVQSMTADFSQTDARGRTLTGQLLLKRPGKVRFQYQKGVPLLIVGDGHALTMIDYSVKQVSRWPVGNSPLAVLLDPARDLARFARVLPESDAARLLVAARDPRHPEFGTTTLVFARQPGAPAGLSLSGWSTLDAQGNRTSVRLANQKFNVAIDEGAFRWTDPRPQGPRAHG